MTNTTVFIDDELMNHLKVCGTFKTLPMIAKEIPIERKYCSKCNNWLGNNSCLVYDKIINPDIYDCSFYEVKND